MSRGSRFWFPLLEEAGVVGVSAESDGGEGRRVFRGEIGWCSRNCATVSRQRFSLGE